MTFLPSSLPPCAIAESAADALTLAGRLKPDMCLVSAVIEQGEGLWLAHRISELRRAPRAIIHTEDRAAAS